MVTFELPSGVMGATLDLVAYRNSSGDEPFTNWLNDLDAVAAAKVTTVLLRLTHGNLSGLKSVGGGVLERSIDWGPGYRVYLGREGERLLVLLGGGTKARQQRDIATARQRWADYKLRRSSRQGKS